MIILMKKSVILNGITHSKNIELIFLIHFTSTIYQICETNFNLKLEKNTFESIEKGDRNNMLMTCCVYVFLRQPCIK